MNSQSLVVTCLSIVAFLMSDASCCAQDPEVGAKMDAAKAAFFNGDLANGPLTSTLREAEKLERLGCSYRNEGKYHEAEPPLLQALAIREKALGPKHILVAVSLNQLAMLYALEEKLDDAQVFTNRASAIWKDVPKPLSSKEVDPKGVVVILNNIGVMLLNGGKNTEAEELFSEAINLDPTYRLPYDNRAIVRKILGYGKGADEDRAKGRELSY